MLIITNSSRPTKRRNIIVWVILLAMLGFQPIIFLTIVWYSSSKSKKVAVADKVKELSTEEPGEKE